jgi:2-keto-4-pentenoate hydratase/2-oxohepta-3-ene-1,7-dioic acid hydratase in catechol pathway
MHIARYLTPDGPHLGLLVGDEVRQLPQELATGSPFALPQDVEGGGALPLEHVKLLAPIRPGKIIGVGLNYRDHAEEQGVALPERPLLFAKFSTAASGPYADIGKLPEISQLDYEAELGVVIGRTARRVHEAEALEYVGGYLVVNDVSARDAQMGDGQWVRGKSFDGFAPMGPALVTPDEIPDPHDLSIRAWVNGELRQDSNTRNMIFGIPELIEYCSRYFTLEPGDLICSGTPAGVGLFMNPPRFLEIGDLVEVEVERVGTLANRVVVAK